MRFIENRRIAWVVLVVCILCSIVLLGGGGLSAARKDAEVMFLSGEYATGVRYSMDAYLDNSSASARMLAETARLHLDDEAAIDAVFTAADALEESDDINARYPLYKDLSASVESLYAQLIAAGAEEETDVLISYGDFKGAADRMERDPYHELAQKFNKDLSSFPANLIGSLFGVEKLDTYGW